MKIKWTFLATLSLLLLITTTVRADIKTDYDRSVNFSGYKTYSWEKVKTSDSLWVDRVKQAVDSQLEAKGWTRVESGGQVAIMAIELTHNERTLDTFYSGFGGRWRWGGGFGNTTTAVDTYQVGTLVVDLFDTQSHKLIWRGSSTDTLSDKSDTNIKNLNKDVEKMFDHFPPKVKTGRR